MIVLGEIEINEKELYVYGFFMLLSRLLYLIITAIAGALFGVALESVAFYLAFIIIRSYAGGIHAANETACTILTSVSMLISVFVIKICVVTSPVLIPALSQLIASLSVVILCPMDTPEKKLTAYEMQLYRKKTIIAIAVLALLSSLGIITRWRGLLYSCSVSITLEAMLLIVAWLGDKKVKKDNF